MPGALTHLRVEPDGSLSLLDGSPPEGTRLLNEFFECDVTGSDPALLDVDASGLAGTVVLGGGAGGVWTLDLVSGELSRLAEADPYDIEGALAPDGLRLAATRYDESGGGSRFSPPGRRRAGVASGP